MQTTALSLVGEYGDLFWDLSPSLAYVAGTEVFAHFYVANNTDTDREYMLAGVLSRGETILGEFTIKVNDKAWFEVEAESVVRLPGAMVLSYSDAALTVNLLERETGEITDSVVVALTTQGTQYWPTLPGLPGAPGGTDISSIMNMMIMLIVVVMMMKMMMNVVGGKK